MIKSISAGGKMTLTEIQQLISQEIQSLPDELAVEVLDFIQFLKAREQEESFLWEQVEETRSYRHKHPEDVITQTGDEWLEYTDHFNKE